MIFIKKFTLLDEREENDMVLGRELRRIHNSNYPVNIFSMKRLKEIELSDITCFYGGNGSGKTTLLNIIAEKLNTNRKSIFSKSTIFDYYVKACETEFGFYDDPLEIKMVTSDDVFDYLLDIRSINASVNRKKDMLSREYLAVKFSKSENNFDDYEELTKRVDVRKKSMSKYVRERLGNNNIIEQSNGESALMFWEREINEESIYILDEPENSLSAENQLKLKQFIEDSVRFYNCQFIISTHSPFLLSLQDAKIYDLDKYPAGESKWTDLSNVKLYYNFFKEREEEFK